MDISNFTWRDFYEKKNTDILPTIYLYLIFSRMFKNLKKKKSETTTLSKLYNYKPSDITKIGFVDMKIRSTKPPLVVDDRKKIDEFLETLDRCELKRGSEKDARLGWTYQAALYSNDKQIVLITFGNPMLLSTNDFETHEYYFPMKNEITPEQIDNFLKSVNPTWVPWKPSDDLK